MIRYEPGVREPKSGTAKLLWDKVVRETGQAPLRLDVCKPGPEQRVHGACSHSMDVLLDGVPREFLAWWPDARELAVALRGCYYDPGTHTHHFGDDGAVRRRP